MPDVPDSIHPASIGVLLVEDDPLVAQTLEGVLQDLGFSRVSKAASLCDGEAMLQVERPGLGILDVNLGKELVFPLAHRLRERGIPFVFSSGGPLSQIPPEFANHPTLSKPSDISDWVATLRSLGFSIGTSDDATPSHSGA